MTARAPRFLLQTRPVEPPDWWPKIDGGWVSVDEDGWSASKLASMASPFDGAKIVALWFMWLLEHEGESWAWRLVAVQQPPRPRRKARKPGKGRAGARGRGR